MNESKVAKTRNSNIELLRIISMLMITISHYTVHNGVSNYDLPLGFNRFLLEIGLLGNIGVCIFVIITGFFGIQKEKPFNIKKLFLLVAQVWFYSIIIYFVFVMTGKTQFSLANCLKSFLPISFKQYWFMTAYIVLYIFTNYLNSFINSLTQNQYRYLIATSISLFAILKFFTTQDYYCNELIQLTLLYFLGAFIYKEKDLFYKFKERYWLILAISIVIVAVSVIIFDLLGTKIPIFGNYSNYLIFTRTSPFVLIISISIFCILNYREVFNSRIINRIASYALGVYLISDNPLIRGILWKDCLMINSWVQSPFLIVHLLGNVLLVYVICTLIDAIRKNTLEKVISSLYDKISNRLNVNQGRFAVIYHKILSVFSKTES